MNIENPNEAISKKPCTFCKFVRVFAVGVFLLTVLLYALNVSARNALELKAKDTMEATYSAENE